MNEMGSFMGLGDLMGSIVDPRYQMFGPNLPASPNVEDRRPAAYDPLLYQQSQEPTQPIYRPPTEELSQSMFGGGVGGQHAPEMEARVASPLAAQAGHADVRGLNTSPRTRLPISAQDLMEAQLGLQNARLGDTPAWMRAPEDEWLR